MHRALKNAAFLVLAVSTTVSCSFTKPEQIASPNTISIPFEKYTLDNGLTVILHKDNSDPLVHVDVTYHVGSAREFPGQSGFAHFFEHMMFQGSEHVADEQHFKVVTQAGGDLNGTTNNDRTNYYQTVPSNQLERMLWLESDRMGFLLKAVTQEKFEIQRETVKNERAQRVDNQPYGLRTEAVSQALYPTEHPYSWPVIGFIEDLERVGVKDLKDFFLRWYGPNNAVLTIGGDFDEKQVKQWIEQYFGEIPAGPAVSEPEPQPVNLAEDRYITLEDQIHLPLLQKTLPTVHARHPDEAPLDVLADILGGGKTSLLYKNLVKTGDAVQAFVSHPCRELACEFQIIALANPAQTPDLGKLEKKINASLKEFEARGVLADDLSRTKASIESATVFGLQSVAGKVSLLAANQTFHGQPDLVEEDLVRYNSVTADDVLRVYNKYVKNKASVVLSMVPHGQVALAAKPQDYVFPDRLIEEAGYTAMEDREAKSSFDRSILPPMGKPPVVNVPEFWESNLDNGLSILGIESYETPTVNISIAFEGGILLDSLDKAGLASVTASLMNDSTLNFDNETMANELEKLGSSISFSANGRYTTVSVSALTKNLDSTLSLLEEKLFRPAFSNEDFQRLMQRVIQSKSQQKNNPSILGAQARDTILFGKNNRVSLPDTGSITSIQTITLDDVKAFYDKYYTSAKASVIVVGAIAEDQVRAKLKFLNNLRSADYTIPDYTDFPEYEGQSIYVVDKPNAVQSVVKLVVRSNPYDATGEYFKSQLMNFPLGGAFNSRINLNLREEKGVTYGASASFIGGKSLGWYEAGADVIQDSTGLAISELLQEIRLYKEQGITADELLFMQNAYTQSDALDYETPASKAGFLRRMSAFDLPANFKEIQLAMINDIDEQGINAVAKTQLKPDDMQIIVVGNLNVIMPQLEALGLPIKKLELTE
jgi:zinc protease